MTETFPDQITEKQKSVLNIVFPALYLCQIFTLLLPDDCEDIKTASKALKNASSSYALEIYMHVQCAIDITPLDAKDYKEASICESAQANIDMSAKGMEKSFTEFASNFKEFVDLCKKRFDALKKEQISSENAHTFDILDLGMSEMAKKLKDLTEKKEDKKEKPTAENDDDVSIQYMSPTCSATTAENVDVPCAVQ